MSFVFSLWDKYIDLPLESLFSFLIWALLLLLVWGAGVCLLFAFVDDACPFFFAFFFFSDLLCQTFDEAVVVADAFTVSFACYANMNKEIC